MAALDKYEVRDRFARIPGMPGDMLELVMELMDGDVDGYYDPDVLLRGAQGFKAVGAHMERAAKAAVEPRIRGGKGDSAKALIGDVIFAWKEGYDRMIVDQPAVKKMFPMSEYPELYKKSVTKESIEAR